MSPRHSLSTLNDKFFFFFFLKNLLFDTQMSFQLKSVNQTFSNLYNIHIHIRKEKNSGSTYWGLPCSFDQFEVKNRIIKPTYDLIREIFTKDIQTYMNVWFSVFCINLWFYFESVNNHNLSLVWLVGHLQQYQYYC